jgi:hypothetical protein
MRLYLTWVSYGGAPKDRGQGGSCRTKPPFANRELSTSRTRSARSSSRSRPCDRGWFDDLRIGREFHVASFRWFAPLTRQTRNAIPVGHRVTKLFERSWALIC